MRILVSSSAVDLEAGGWIPSLARKVQLPCRWQVPTHFPSRNHCLTTSDDIKTRSGRSGREGLKKPSISEGLQWDFLHDTPHVMSCFFGKAGKNNINFCGTLFWDKPNLETKKSVSCSWSPSHWRRCFRSCTIFCWPFDEVNWTPCSRC